MDSITAHTHFERLIVEVLGPAGAGKTTLVRALRHRGIPVRGQLVVPWATKLSVLTAIAGELLPAYLRHRPRSRSFSIEELRRLLYVKSWQRAMQRPGVADGSLTLLDHGPIFMLAMVQEFGPEFVRSNSFLNWFDGAVTAWSFALDLVIWLDAPDRELVRRIEQRERYHTVKGKPFSEACAYLGRCRHSFESILSQMNVSGGPEVVRFQTDIVPLDEMIEGFLQRVAPFATTEFPRPRTANLAIQ